MTTNDLTIFFLVMAAGASGLVFFIFAFHALMNILRTAEPIGAPPMRGRRNAERSVTLAERRKRETTPTITCAMPMAPQVRVEERLW
jgi:hypothetical protein